MAIRNEEWKAANKRAADRRRRTPTATAAYYEPSIDRILIDLSSGIGVAFRPHDAQGLEHAKPDDLAEIEISPSGLGIYFPRLDADIYIPALQERLLGSRQWMATEMGARGGKATTDAKAAAARENGRRGGRPRKPKEPIAT